MEIKEPGWQYYAVERTVIDRKSLKEYKRERLMGYARELPGDLQFFRLETSGSLWSRRPMPKSFKLVPISTCFVPKLYRYMMVEPEEPKEPEELEFSKQVFKRPAPEERIVELQGRMEKGEPITTPEERDEFENSHK